MSSTARSLLPSDGIEIRNPQFAIRDGVLPGTEHMGERLPEWLIPPDREDLD